MDRAAPSFIPSPCFVSGRSVALLLLMFLCACTIRPTIRTHPELAQRKHNLQRVGLIPPTIAMFEEKAHYRTKAHSEWGAVATQSLAKAFVAEAKERQMPLLLLDADQPQVAEVADLFAALDLSITAHDYGPETGQLFDEHFTESLPPFVRVLGPLDGLQEGEDLDGVWLIQGINLLPTPAARWGDAGVVTMAVIAAIGLQPASLRLLDKFELHAALVDRSGAVLFHCVIGEAHPQEGFVPVDLRDERYARAVVKAIFTAYRQGVAP